MSGAGYALVMNNVEYSVEPNGDIALHTARAARLAQVAFNRGCSLEGLTRTGAYRVRDELAQFCDFPLRVRGSAAG